MARDRDVLRATVMAVLKHHGVLICDMEGQITLTKDDFTETIPLPDSHVSYRMLQRFQWRYGIPIFYFYHPEAMPVDAAAHNIKRPGKK
jgi:hypothetical protein